ncbi:MAG: glycosyltransferase, partial [Gemmatimonadaceae bacterium]
VFLQGSAVGRPVIVGNSGGAPETLKPGVTGLLVDPERPEPIADALLTLLRDPARAIAMGNAGAAWVHSEWTWNAMSSRLHAMLDALGNGERVAPRPGA